MAANKSITELPWFKKATVIYVVLAVIFASIILWDLWNNYILDISIDGLNHSISSIFAPLVKLTAAYASFVGLLALNHRSIQSKEQIGNTLFVFFIGLVEPPIEGGTTEEVREIKQVLG